ncbi:sodium/panthothenate symporter [Virgibacillus pantothenticus]|uniref:Sodium/panthothenate symporter n=1 Tax=Virgibacillus pantothenticus TaxID=1473 RepID=A0A0L0QJX9_VIRPA|nr:MULTISPECIES: sodium/pantothenate symporter [Virgibacillus]API92828.1 sodium/panthothenate symporter [Virgibacillus sp. 6R]KNE18935.1 sodium/panthothenate symporter [Virgibacillus pantothenticus]MBS7428337.1 sodium/pantothenate symporter [Virgibacillus sp. 19R1-5]MBU8565230.1 sodium/pantothenate symporter [Virgibacillus pantothenticus]MBU8601514.1 sodium/pantothenate symporter [Virgibacillus pantothenticus]
MNWESLVPLIVILIIIFGVGIWAGGYLKASTNFAQDYFLGGRSLGGFVLAMTMTATYGSASSFIGGPGTAYNEGLGWVLLAMSQVATGYFVLMVLGKKFAVITRKYKALTMVDFLKERYQSKWVVIFSAVSIIVFLFSAMAAQWIGGARLIESLMGINYTSALFIFAVAVLIYVTVGGFRAVALTDAIQGSIMFGGTLILLIAVIIAGGGVPAIIADLSAENPNLITPYGSEGQLTPAYVSSFWILVGVGVVALPQIAVRAMSYKNSQSMHRAIIIGTIVVGFIMLNMHLIGVFARPILPGIEVGDKVMPLIALEVMPNWLAGIVLAAPMAAIMSTVDSLLLLVSSTIVKDVYLNYVKPDASQQTIKRISIGITALLGVIIFLMALNPPDLIIWLNLFAFGGLEAAFIWPIVLGLYWEKGNKYGALASMIAGVGLYILSDTFFPQPFGIHSVVMPVVISFFVYVVVSLLTQKQVAKLHV